MENISKTETGPKTNGGALNGDYECRVDGIAAGYIQLVLINYRGPVSGKEGSVSLVLPTNFFPQEVLKSNNSVTITTKDDVVISIGNTI